MNFSRIIIKESEWPTPGISLIYPMWAFALIVPVFAILIIWTIVGNALVMMAIAKYPKLRSMSNYLIANLALSDLFVAIAVLPFAATTDVTGYWIFGDVLCSLWLSIDVFLCTASVWNLVVIAMDRFTATNFPVWYRVKRKKIYPMLYITFVWLFSILICLPGLFGWGTDFSEINNSTEIMQTYMLNKETNRYDCILYDQPSYVIYSALGSFIIPFFIMLVLYAKICTILTRRGKSSRAKKKATFNALYSNYSSHTAASNNPSRNESQITLNRYTYFKNNKQDKKPAESQTGSKVFIKRTSKSEEKDTILSSVSKNTLINECSSSLMSLVPQNVKNINVNSPKLQDPCPINLPSPLLVDDEGSLGSKRNSQCTTTPQSDLNAFNYPDSPKIIDEELNLLHTNKIRQPSLNKMVHNNMPTRFIKNEQQKSTKLVRTPENKTMVPTPEKTVRRSGIRAFISSKLNLSYKDTNPMKMEFDKEFERADSRERRATVQMGLLIFCFVLCWIPFTLMYIIRSLCGNQYCPDISHLRVFLTWLGYFNSGLNPILYAVFNEDFQKAFVSILSCSK